MPYHRAVMIQSVRHSIHLTLCAGLAVLAMTRPLHAQSPEITIATWGGTYGDAQQAATFKPFTRATGISIRIHHHGSDYQPLFEAAARRTAPWSVVDVERDVLDRGCADGTFEKLDAELLIGKEARDDFIAGTLHPCGIGSLIWSQAVAYDAVLFKDRPPLRLADFFDLARFPGRRGLFAGAEGNLEIALMATGIPAQDVYDILKKPRGVDQALAQLDIIRPVAVFWQAGDEPEQLLNDGRVAMTTAYAARFMRPRQGARRPAGLLRDHTLWRATYWAVPGNVADPASAQRFIAFATDPERLAGLATRLWYGPARKSGLDAVPVNIRDALPTARKNFHDALQINSAFWAEFGPAIEARFRAWMAR
ncbi:MAG: extracellular solute-binding protein [Rhodospirillales bacterium]